MKTKIILSTALATLSLSACATPTGPRIEPIGTATPRPATSAIASPARLRSDVEKLVSFGTRHTLSSATDPVRGIGAARKWGFEEFQRISAACGGCLEVTTVARRMTGSRIPQGVEIVDVLATLRGTDDPNQVVLITGHIDSRASDVMDAVSDAPGANDDGSGTALVIEAARLLSKQRHRGTIVFGLLSGEEQGLFGGRLIAEHAKAKGWNVVAMLNNDIVGGTHGQNGSIVDNRVRVFSEGIRDSEDLAAQKARRQNGGEDDGPSRALAKAAIRAGHMSRSPLEVLAVRRPDRFGRGGDHLPALEYGFPAIRFSVGIEDYDHQHQDVRVENGIKYGDTVDEMDFPYLARVTNLNVALAAELADAAPPPTAVTLEGAVSSDTTVRWAPVAGADHYRVYWRRADRQSWTDHRDTKASELVLKDVIVDDNFFGVASVSPGGEESIVTFGGAAAR